MTTTYIAKLTYKNNELDLNSGNYRLGPDFVPPSINEVVQIGSGTSANRLGGGRLISKKAQDRRWAFGVHIDGTSDAEIARAAGNLQWYLHQAGDPSNPVYFEYRANSDVGFEPLWGQYGANLRYEILSGKLSLSTQYGVATLRGMGLPSCPVELVIKPFALGLQQRLGSAVGGILEDIIGTTDGISRGTIIPEATTNKMTNPIFGYSTWNNGWTATSLTATENTDPAFIAHGKSSAKLTDPSGGGQFTQSIDVGNTNAHVLSCYAKLPNGGVISATQAQLYYGSAKTTTYTLIGNGIYRLTASVTGIASATATGIEIKSGYTVYTDGFQIEEKAYATPLCHGDMLGCSWSGTAHASTSSRTAAQLKIATADSLDNAEGTIRIVWKTDYANTISHSLFHFNMTGLTFRGLFDYADDKFKFQDSNGNNIESAAQTFAAGDIMIFHYVYGPGTMKIYKNSSEIATGSVYAPPAFGTNLYIGLKNDVTDHAGGTFMGFETFAQAMSATEVSNDYANILEHVEDDRRLSPIPWLWTKDGDDVVDNCDDSTRDNYCVIGGIPGSVQAETEMQMLKAGESLPGIYIARCRMPYNKFVYPTSQWYAEMQGTSDGACSGGQYEQTAVSTATVVETLDPDYPEEFRGDIHFFGRLGSDATENVWITPVMYFGPGGDVIEGDQKYCVLINGFRWYYLGSMYFDYPKFVDDTTKQSRWGIEVTDGTFPTNFRGDFLMALNGELIHVDGNVYASYYLTISKESVYRTDSAGSLLSLYPTKGRKIELLPEELNYIWIIMANDTGILTITDTMTFTSVEIRPRWTLL